MKKHITLIVILSTFLSCTRHKSETFSTPVEEINISVNNNNVNFSDFFNGYKIIQIKDKLLGRIEMLYEVDNKIIFKSSSGNHRVHIYDLKSEKSISIAEKGKGPGQLTSVTDMYVYNKNIYVLDAMKKNLYEYSLAGKLNKIIKMPDYCDNIFPIDSSAYVLYKQVPYYPKKEEYKVNIYSSSEKNKLINQFIPAKAVELHRGFGQPTTLYPVNDTVRLTQAFSDIIYDIFPDRIQARFKMNFGKYELPIDKYFNEKLDLTEFVDYCKESDNIWYISYVLENSENLFFLFKHSNNLYSNIYNKICKKCFTFTSMNDDLFLLKNNLAISEEFIPVSISENFLYFLIEPYFLIEEIESKKKNNIEEWKKLRESNHPLFKLANELKIDDNSLIIKYQFK